MNWEASWSKEMYWYVMILADHRVELVVRIRSSPLPPPLLVTFPLTVNHTLAATLRHDLYGPDHLNITCIALATLTLHV